MKETLKKFDRVAAKAADGRKPFNLFALFHREGQEGWDLVVSAPWLSPERIADFAYLHAAIRRVLSAKEAFLVTRTTIVDKGSWLFNVIVEALGERRGFIDAPDITLGDSEVRKAYVIEARTNPPAPSKPRKRRGPVTGRRHTRPKASSAKTMVG